MATTDNSCVWLIDRNEQSLQRTSIDASYQVSIHYAKRFQRRFLKISNICIEINAFWQTWTPQAIPVSDWSSSKKSSPLKPLGQMNRNLVGSGQSETRIAYGGHACWWIGTKWAIFREDLPSIDASYQLGRKHLWQVLYKNCSFRTDPLTNMAATGNSCFRLVDF
jgi:hypothetical protein